MCLFVWSGRFVFLEWSVRLVGWLVGWIVGWMVDWLLLFVWFCGDGGGGGGLFWDCLLLLLLWGGGVMCLCYCCY